MSLIEHQRLVRRKNSVQHTFACPLGFKIGEEYMMIHNDELCAGCFEPNPNYMAFFMIRAARREAIIAFGTHAIPYRVIIRQREIGFVATSAIVVPFEYLPQFYRGIRKERVFFDCFVQSSLAQVISPAFHHRRFGWFFEKRTHDREILFEYLLLEVYCRGGNDDAFIVADCPGKRRNEIRERFADPRACFRNQNASIRYEGSDIARHVNLRSSWLEFGHFERKLATIVEYRSNFVRIERANQLCAHRLRDDKDFCNCIIDDIAPEAIRSSFRRYQDIGIRRKKFSGGMIVNENLCAVSIPKWGRDCAFGSARKNFELFYKASGIQCANCKDFPSFHVGDGILQFLLGLRCKSLDCVDNGCLLFPHRLSIA